LPPPDLVNALEELVKSRAGQLDHIVIETSGLAHPGPVAALFWVDTELDASVQVSAVFDGS
jgi:G3E family GTPase